MSLTKAQRKARQRQRSSLRKEDLPRAPSGALSRSSERYRIEGEITQKDATIVVMQARQRVNGLNADVAATAEAGSAIGRLLLARRITRRLYEAANRFDEEVAKYHAVIGFPHPSCKAIDYSRVKGLGCDPDQAVISAVTNRYMLAIGVVQQVDRAGRPVESAIRHAVVMDQPIDNWPDHMIAYLTRGLMALADHYGIGAYDDELVLRAKTAGARP